MSPFGDTDLGRMSPNFKCTVYFFSGRWPNEMKFCYMLLLL